MTPKEYALHYYQFQLFYLSSQLDYLTASKGKGPWQREEVELKLAYIKERLEELSSYA
jgi:hypothetical protein